MMETMTDAERSSSRHSGPPTDEELAELMDPESWDWDSAYMVEPDPARKVTLRLSLHFDADESRLLGDAARAANMPMTRYIKYVALEAAKRSPKVASERNRRNRTA
jgi:hypothetical protein